MTPTPNRSPTTLRLVRCPLTLPGHDMGLHPGDILVGIDGRLWHGTMSGLRSHFRTCPRRVLTFLRGGVAFSVIATSAGLGIWDPVEFPPDVPDISSAGRPQVAWQVLAGPDGRHDLIPLRPALLALAVPVFWLAEHRLWTWLATLSATLALALPAGLVAAGVVWVCFGLHLWRSGATHLVRERIAAGSRPLAIIAAPDAAAAAKSWMALAPGARMAAGGVATEGPAAAPLPAASPAAAA